MTTLKNNIKTSKNNIQRAIDTGMTCIDCHQGIAHNLPAGFLDEYRHVVDGLNGSVPVNESSLLDLGGMLEATRSFLGVNASH